MREEGQGIAEHILFSDFATDPAKSFRQAEISLVTNSLTKSTQKWQGLSLLQADQLISVCKHEKVTCLIEADGARHLHLKAPADWEPVIPPLVDLVIVVVGLSALGKPLDPETVFRPEIFSQLTGLPVGETIRLEHVLKMLNHPAGGLKGVPSNSRAAIVFNQADAYSIKTQELALINHALSDRYFGAILTCLQKDPERCEVITNFD
jgi:probable selenium-dependent hydroxylase accessory protein YqeC